MFTFEGRLLTTSPTAMSSLLLGFAMYGFLAMEGRPRGGERGKVGNEVRGARAQLDRDMDARDGFKLEREADIDDTSDIAGDAVRS